MDEKYVRIDQQSEIILETLKNLYDIWSAHQTTIDDACERIEDDVPEKVWKKVEQKIVEELSQLQERSFWAGAQTVMELEKKLKNLSEASALFEKR